VRSGTPANHEQSDTSDERQYTQNRSGTECVLSFSIFSGQDMTT